MARKALGGQEHRIMLDGGDDDLRSALLFEEMFLLGYLARDAEDGGIVSLGGRPGEDDLVRTGAEGQRDVCARLLKALLLVKYCRDFKATPGNLRVLLYGSFNERPGELGQKMKDALDELERQTYVRRNGGNEYEYLTDEEKEVENEIKATQVSEAEAYRLIARLFQDVVGPTRVTYKNGAFEHVYSLNLRVDGEGQGAQRNDLTLDLVTDFIADGLYGAGTPTQPKTLAVRLVDARGSGHDLFRNSHSHNYSFIIFYFINYFSGFTISRKFRRINFNIIKSLYFIF